MGLIAITGRIASGKSTAIKLLSHWKTFQNKNIKYINLDVYCKNLKNQSFPELNKFFKDKFNNSDIPNSNFIVNEVFTNDKLYQEFCECFALPIYNYLKSLLKETDIIYVVEASALYTYETLFPEGKISNLFDSIIVIQPNETILKRNIETRNIDKKTLDIINSRQTIIQNNKNIFVNIENGTLQELRGKTEEAFIRAIRKIDNSSYVSDAVDCLNYLSTHFSKNSWNNNPYHNIDHTRYVLTDLILANVFTKVLGLAAIYHDINYDPKSSENEKISAEYTYTNILDNKFLGKDSQTGKSIKIEIPLAEVVADTVLNSGYKDLQKCPNAKNLFLSDISSFTKSLDEIIEAERLLFKEYSFYDWALYQEKHIEILNDIKKLDILDEDYITGINHAISFTKSFKPKIGWFCGSFNPFTIGHNDILQKAEQQFDKVVLIQAKNPIKSDSHKLSENANLSNYQIICDVKSIPNLIANTLYKPTLIRGIRNNQDLEDSKIWFEQIREFNPDVNMILILGDIQYNHISSSFVRNVQSLGKSIDRFII
jgi:cytidyltransferase-like protein